MLSANRLVLFITREIKIDYLRVVHVFDPRLDFLLCECLIVFLVYGKRATHTTQRQGREGQRKSKEMEVLCHL